MPIRATVANKETLTLSGWPDDIPPGRIMLWCQDIGLIIEERIALDFEKERAAGKALGGVTSEHEQRKAADGLDLRKGHMYGDLQFGIDQGGFSRVTVTNGKAFIKFDERVLDNRVPHAIHYRTQKVKGDRILVVLQKDATEAAKYLRARVREWQQGTETRIAVGERRQRRANERLIRTAARVIRRGVRVVFGV